MKLLTTEAAKVCRSSQSNACWNENSKWLASHAPIFVAFNQTHISELWNHPGTKSGHQRLIHRQELWRTWNKHGGLSAVFLWRTESNTFRCAIYRWILNILGRHRGIDNLSKHSAASNIGLTASSYGSNVLDERFHYSNGSLPEWSSELEVSWYA